MDRVNQDLGGLARALFQPSSHQIHPAIGEIPPMGPMRLGGLLALRPDPPHLATPVAPGSWRYLRGAWLLLRGDERGVLVT